MRRITSVMAAVMLTGCGSGLSGDYGGEACLYNKLSFKDDGDAYVTFMGTEAPAQYKIDGDRVAITTAGGQGIVFTKKGDALEAVMLGDTMRCEKL